jgi:hypothetical protein
MRTALFNGILGVILVFGVGMRILGLTSGSLVECILATQLGAWVSLFFILRLERVSVVRRKLINRPFKTWILFLSAFFGVSVLAGAPLREFRNFLWLEFPLILTTGFAIIVFGPIQDFLVQRDQRHAALRGARK